MKKMTRFMRIACIIVLGLNISGSRYAGSQNRNPDPKLPVKVKPILISQLGPEHFGNAIYRRGLNGPGIAASGMRILEWPLQASAPTTEVVPPGPNGYQNGACAMDINEDGIDEMIVGRSANQSETSLLWFEELPGQSVWKEHLIALVNEGDGEKGLHDIMPIKMEVSGKPMKGIATVVNRKRLNWYQASDDITRPWTEHLIADLGAHGAECAQSGLVTGDIAGKGRQDLVCGNFWAECPADPSTESWKIHRYSNWDQRTTPTYPDLKEWVFETRFGGMNQLDLGDLNNDGMLEIVATDAEIPEARVGVFCRDKTNPEGPWLETIIDTGIYCPHSLVVADVNADNQSDILVGEMTAGGWWFPRNPDPKLYLYLNMGNLKFSKYVLHHGWGSHMMRMVPTQDQKGVFVFAADEIQTWYSNMTTHVVGWTISPEKVFGGVVLYPSDIISIGSSELIRFMREANLNLLGIHTNTDSENLNDLKLFLESMEGLLLLEECKKYDISVEYESHVIKEILPRELFGKHPEYFPQDGNGVRQKDYNMCFSSEGAYLEIEKKIIELTKWLKPTTHRYFLWTDDGAAFCKCDLCKEYSGSEQALMYENRLLAILRKTDPMATLAHLAYHNTLKAPIRIKPSDGVFLEYAPISRDYSLPLPEEHLQNLKENLKVFPVNSAHVLEYWLDASMFSEWNRNNLVQVPWNIRNCERDIKLYTGLGIQSVTSFGTWMISNDYFRKYGGNSALQMVREYGAVLDTHL